MNLARRAKTRREVLQAFWQLYKQKSIDTITITEIMHKAGYSRQTFYQYFKDLNELKDLVYSILDPIQNALVQGKRLSFENVVELNAQQYSGHGYDHDLHCLLEQSPELSKAHAEYSSELLWQTYKWDISIQREEFELLFKSFHAAMTACLDSWSQEYQDSIPIDRVNKLLNLIFNHGYRKLIFRQDADHMIQFVPDHSQQQSLANGFG